MPGKIFEAVCTFAECFNIICENLMDAILAVKIVNDNNAVTTQSYG